MSVGGIGLDACESDRMRRALGGSTGMRFRDRVFTERERAYCEGRGRTRVESFAARFAAKEAVMKALGTGYGDGVWWRDIEVVRMRGGRPTLLLHGGALARAGAIGAARWHLSLTHTAAQALAHVVAES